MQNIIVNVINIKIINELFYKFFHIKSSKYGMHFTLRVYLNSDVKLSQEISDMPFRCHTT